jgi:hypothetical protein
LELQRDQLLCRSLAWGASSPIAHNTL